MHRIQTKYNVEAQNLNTFIDMHRIQKLIFLLLFTDLFR